MDLMKLTNCAISLFFWKIFVGRLSKSLCNFILFFKLECLSHCQASHLGSPANHPSPDAFLNSAFLLGRSLMGTRMKLYKQQLINHCSAKKSRTIIYCEELKLWLLHPIQLTWCFVILNSACGITTVFCFTNLFPYTHLVRLCSGVKKLL